MRVLLIAPHADDELFGAGGTLLKLKKAGATIQFVLVACSDVYMHHAGRVVPAEERRREFTEISEALATEPPIVLGMPDSRLDAQSIAELVMHLDKVLMTFKPDVMFIPEPSYHQDHAYVNRACIAALRPTGRARPSRVLAYEVPTSTGIGSPAFIPNWYEDINGLVEEKVRLLETVYRSQFTTVERGALAADGVRRHAKYRGIEAEVDAAEAFVLLRETVR